MSDKYFEQDGGFSLPPANMKTPNQPKDKEWGDRFKGYSLYLLPDVCVDVIGREKNGFDYVGEAINPKELLTDALTSLAQAFFNAVPSRDVAYKPAGNADNMNGWNSHEEATRSALKKIAEDYNIKL